MDVNIGAERANVHYLFTIGYLELPLPQTILCSLAFSRQRGSLA